MPRNFLLFIFIMTRLLTLFMYYTCRTNVGVHSGCLYYPSIMMDLPSFFGISICSHPITIPFLKSLYHFHSSKAFSIHTLISFWLFPHIYIGTKLYVCLRSIGLWQWYINITITVFDTIHRLVFLNKRQVFGLREGPTPRKTGPLTIVHINFDFNSLSQLRVAVVRSEKLTAKDRDCS
jgi:hypothetical protein